MWCKPNEIGGAAQLDTVRAVSAILENVGIVFYKSGHTWVLRDAVSLPLARDRWMVNAEQNVISLDKVTAYSGIAFEDPQIVTAEVGGSSFVYAAREGPHRVFELVGTIGLAMSHSLGLGTSLSAGDSILRDSELIVVESDIVSVEGDLLLEPPSALRAAAIGIGRRLLNLQLDRKAGPSDESSIFTGWFEVLARYKP